MIEEKVSIPCPGLQLEALLSVPEGLPFRGGVICCHPHPQYGGDMYHPVITRAVEAASEESLVTLRFNFRGVGESGGVYGEGIGEKEDVLSAVEYVASRLKSSSSPLIVFGYSFGAWVGLSAGVQDRRIKGLVAIAPPVELYNFGFLKESRKRKLIIAGDRDVYCPVSPLEDWFQDLEEPKSLTLLPGTDHFFFSNTPLLTLALRRFFKTVGE
jgi:uncharacterized protein